MVLMIMITTAYLSIMIEARRCDNFKHLRRNHVNLQPPMVYMLGAEIYHKSR